MTRVIGKTIDGGYHCYCDICVRLRFTIPPNRYKRHPWPPNHWVVTRRFAGGVIENTDRLVRAHVTITTTNGGVVYL